MTVVLAALGTADLLSWCFLLDYYHIYRGVSACIALWSTAYIVVSYDHEKPNRFFVHIFAFRAAREGPGA